MAKAIKDILYHNSEEYRDTFILVNIILVTTNAFEHFYQQMYKQTNTIL